MIVDTAQGKISGLEKRGIHQFRGIPYARAERFLAPEPVAPWTGVREATTFGAIAPQNPSAIETFAGGRERPSSEDCLFLNVFTPAPDDRARPVMVWIHGGAFTSGGSDIPWYDATGLARTGDVVVVSVNYRLGALGFLHLEHLDPAFAGSGRNGIRDQVAALRWVRDNIAGFGGDPGNVTIFGESAGAMSVATLLGTPAAGNLFHRAIAQSGACANVHPPDAAERVTDAVLAELGLSRSSADGLLDAPVDELLRTQATLDAPGNRSVRGADGLPPGVLTFQPVVDGDGLPRPPIDAVRAGEAADIPLIVGTTADEWNIFHVQARLAGGLDADGLAHRVSQLVPADRVDDVIDVYRRVEPHADPDELICAVMTDMVFAHPSVQLAEAQLAHTADVHAYRFDLPSAAMSGELGACHAIEVPFVFDNLDRGGVEMFLGGLDDGARHLAGLVARAWTTMAHEGSPEHDDLAWPRYDTERRPTRILDRTPRVDDDPRSERRLLWAELRP